MAEERIYWLAVSRNGQFPISPRTFTFLEANLRVKSDYCWVECWSRDHLPLLRSSLMTAHSSIIAEADPKGFAIKSFLRTIPTDQETGLIFSTDKEFCCNPGVLLPFIMREVFPLDEARQSTLRAIGTARSTVGSQGLILRHEFKVVGHNGLRTETERATAIAKFLAEDCNVLYVRAAAHRGSERTKGFSPTST